MSPFVFNGRLTENDVVLMTHYVGLLEISRGVRWVAFVMIICGAVCAVWWPFEFHRDVTAISALVSFSLMCLGIVTWPGRSRWLTRRHYRKHIDEYLETRVCLAPEGVLIENDAQKSSLRWDLIKSLIATPDGLLFCYAGRQPAFWLPKRVLEDKILRDDVLDLAASAGVRIRNVS